MPYIYSVPPETLAGVLNGTITALVCKVVPKAILEGKEKEVYLYCKKNDVLKRVHADGYTYILGGWVGFYDDISGVVPCKVKVGKAEEITPCGERYLINGGHLFGLEPVSRASGLGYKQLHALLQGKTGYAYHITNLEVFDKPKKLGDFHKTSSKVVKGNPNGKGLERSAKRVYTHEPITKAPSTWCYVIPPKEGEGK